MNKTKIAALLASLVMMTVQGQAHANLTLTITQNTTLGGTDWAFSGGSGTIGGSALPYFLVGETAANPQAFNIASMYDTSLTVLAGNNVFGLANLFNWNYGSLTGSNGAIRRGIDFQGSGVWANQSLSLFNGLVLNANSIAYGSFTPGSYTMNSYYTGYNTNFGTFTLNIGAVSNVPEPESMALVGLGLLGLGLSRRNRAAN